MRAFAVLVLLLGASLAQADRARDKAPTKTDKAEKPEKPAACKPVIIGRGLERKVVCEFAPVVVRSSAPKPKVVIVTRDARAIVGRPKSTDPLEGLGPRN